MAGPPLVLSVLLALGLLATPAAAESVVVLGAGGAGLAAAYELKRLKPDADVTVLEGGPGIGGRMLNADFGGDVVQLGANWVQGTEGSWIDELVKKSGVKGTLSNWDSIYARDKDPSDDYYSDYVEVVAPAWGKYEENRQCQIDLSNELRRDNKPDISIRQADKICGWRAVDPLEKAIEWFYHDYEWAEEPVTTSTKNALPLSAYTYYKDEDYFVTDSRGWLPALRELNVPESSIKLNTMVQTIKYGKDGVTVVAQDAVANTNMTFDADYVICTFSIGVLQHNHATMFEPALPKYLHREINKFDMNTYMKIFMRFQEQFWGNEEFFIIADERRGYYPVWQNMEAPGYFPNGTHILMVTVTGEEAIRIEGQSDEATKAEAMAHLRTLFGDDIPDATDILVPKWNQMERFRGSYSNWPIGVTRADHVELRTPVDRLFFAGEAMHPSLNGWIHGALESGRQVARDIVACMAGAESQECKCVYDTTCDTYTKETDPAYTAATTTTTTTTTATTAAPAATTAAPCPTAKNLEKSASIRLSFSAALAIAFLAALL